MLSHVVSVLVVLLVVTSLASSYLRSVPSGTILQMLECGQYADYQIFNENNSNQSYTILNLASFTDSCLDANYGRIDGTPWLYNCNANDNNQLWNLIPNNNNNGNSIQIRDFISQTCLQLTSSDIAFSGIYTQTCDASNVLQQFNIDSKGSISSNANASICITASTTETQPNCTQSPFNSYAYCDQSLPVEQRVNDLIQRMTLTEKVQNLQNNNPGIPRLGVPKNIFHECLHGVLSGCGAKYNNNTGCPTSFPHATLLGATFNRSLWKEIGESISTEARALANQGIVGLFFWAPDINLFRDPRWGRGQEVPGEDPYLTGQYVQQFSYHLQNGEDHKYIKVVSTAKHYADYDQEGNYGIPRFAFNANVTMQDQVEYYWPAWRSAVQTAKVDSIMCSYNAVNGMPSCGNDYFMNEIVRNEWEFEGFFVSDCGAIRDTAFTTYVDEQYPNADLNEHLNEQCRIAIQGGCDTNCGTYYADYLEQSVIDNVTLEEDVDRASRRLWRKTIELGKLDFNPPSYYTTYGADKVDSEKHRAIALSAAKQGIVLLKNDGNLLPLDTHNIDANTQTIAMIGPHADATQDMLSNYHGTNTLVNSHSPNMAIKARNVYNISYVEACNYMCNATDFSAAVTAAKNAQYAIVFLGLHPGTGCEAACEAEGWDRNTIEFPGNQLELLQQVHSVNKNTILVIINGGAIDISWPKANIPAILEAFYPGELGGDAIVNVLFGDVSPAGKLPYTIYDKSFLSARPTIMDMSLRDNGGITYRYYTGVPVYPFGFGLSYTNFSYKYYNNSGNNKEIETKLLADFYKNGYFDYRCEAASFVIQVSNIGQMDSDCVVLGFVRSDSDDAPPIKLFDFQRTFVVKGGKVNVTLSVSPEAISVTNKEGNERIVPGIYELLIGDYANNNYIQTRLVLTGQEQSIFNVKN